MNNNSVINYAYCPITHLPQAGYQSGEGQSPAVDLERPWVHHTVAVLTTADVYHTGNETKTTWSQTFQLFSPPPSYTLADTLYSLVDMLQK